MMFNTIPSVRIHTTHCTCPSRFITQYLHPLGNKAVQRFTVEESMAYIKEKLKDEISVEHFYHMRRQIRKKSLDTKVGYLRGAPLSLFSNSLCKISFFFIR